MRIHCVAGAFAAMAIGLLQGLARADDAPVSGYRGIVQGRQKELIREVKAYMAKNPEAEDYLSAGQWLLTNAAQTGLEAEAVAVAEEFTKRSDVEGETLLQARIVLCLGLAKSGKVDDAATAFEGLTRGTRPQGAGRMLDVAHQLSAQARLQGQKEASRDVYRRLMEAIPFSPLVSEIAESRMNKIELMGKSAPAVVGKDLTGTAIDLVSLRGKVVLVDFWGTNCLPCLEEFPNMKAIYKEYHPKGLEVIGISHDEREADVTEFQQRVKLPWTIVLKRNVEGNVAERYNVVTIPSLFVVDRQGQIVNVDMYGNNLRAAVDKLMQDKP